MAEVEFVDRKAAEAGGKRFVELQNASDDAKVESWFVLKAVADLIGPASNVGAWGITWQPRRDGGRYMLRAACTDGHINTSTGAPGTLRDARREEHLSKARRTLDRAIASKGGPIKRIRPQGTGAALVTAVAASPEGRQWVAARKYPAIPLRNMVRVADTYGREGVYPVACLQAHVVLMAFDDCKRLVRDFPTEDAARAKAISLRHGDGPPPLLVNSVSYARVRNLSRLTGVTEREARIILRALIEGRSKAKLIRAVNEAAKMVEQPNLRVAA